jgi:ubiquinone/menaquinone biosynthesis C-methylase UbiE
VQVSEGYEENVMTETLVRDYYTDCVRREWRRLVKDAYHGLEFQTTLHFLEEHLPQKGLVLDAGGGPGRYTIELARRGYEVVLLDMTPANLEFARRQIRRAKVQDKIANIVEGSIVNLSQFADNTFDATLCLGGPLSHVLDAHKRDKAISELIRVTKKRAPIVVSVMGRLSLLVIELTLFQNEIEMPHFEQIRDTGDYAGGSGFTACHFFLPEELRADFSDRGVTIVDMVGLEGISSHHDSKLNQLAKDEKRWKIWLETHYRTCTHPSVVGMSEHLMIICRKSSGSA